MPGSWPLVGREAERAFLAKAIAEGAAGAVLAGDAGVGKTRLALEALREAQGQGCATTWVVATRAGGCIPFGPFAHLLPEGPTPTSSRLDLMRRIVDKLLARAQGRRVVVGVDDAHLLDDASAALVHQLAVTRGGFVLLTVRAGENAPDPIISVWKDAVAERLEVRALSADQVAELASQALGGQVDGPTMATLLRVTRGNVLFLRELLLAGLDSGALTEAGGVWSWRGPIALNSRLQEVVADRMRALEASQIALTEVLAHGEPVAASFLEARFAPATLEATERSGVVVVETEGQRVLVRLAHPLYGEAVRARCPTLRARAIHRELAAALEATGARRREDLLRLVDARLQAGERGPPSLFVAGARRALAVFDPLLAEGLARVAVADGGGFPAHHALAESLWGQGRFCEAESLLSALNAAVANDSERAVVACQMALTLWHHTRLAADAERVLLSAEAEIANADLRDEVKGMRGIILVLADRPADAMALVSGILECPQAGVRACVCAALAAVLACGVSGYAEKAAAIAERWIEAAERLRDELPLLAGRLRASHGHVLCLAGHLDEAEALVYREYRKASDEHAHDATALSALVLGRVAMSRGCVETARRWLREAAALFRAPSEVCFLPGCLAGLAQAAALAGDLPAAAATLAEVEGLSPGMTDVEPQLAIANTWLAAGHGELSKARAIALQEANRAEQCGEYALAVTALHDVARLGDAPAVAPRLRRLASAVEGLLAPACAAHAEALAARDGPRLDESATSFEAIGAQLLAAEAAAEAAAAHRAQGKKASMLASSARARRLLEACEGARTPALSSLVPKPLTPREREVAMLARAGLTSIEIARRLVLSTRTVEGHLQRAYAKLGVSSRKGLRSVLGEPGASRTMPGHLAL